MYLVICYSIHEQEVSSVDVFDNIDKARDFMCTDAHNTFADEKAYLGPDDSLTIYNYEDKFVVNSCDGTRIWTWDVVLK